MFVGIFFCPQSPNRSFLRFDLFLCFLCDLKFFEINLVRLPLGHFQAILTVAKIYSSCSNLISPYTADQSTQILLQ